MSRKFKFESKKGKEKINLFGSEKITGADLVKGAHIELFSNKELYVDGCFGVYEYREDYIKLNLGKGSIILCGKDFDIPSFEGESITVRGEISSLEFCI